MILLESGTDHANSMPLWLYIIDKKEKYFNAKKEGSGKF